ncbi:MAG: hypothetical protein ACI4J2_00540 [Ruminococcus sp.]
MSFPKWLTAREQLWNFRKFTAQIYLPEPFAEAALTGCRTLVFCGNSFMDCRFHIDSELRCLTRLCFYLLFFASS